MPEDLFGMAVNGFVKPVRLRARYHDEISTLAPRLRTVLDGWHIFGPKPEILNVEGVLVRHLRNPFRFDELRQQAGDPLPHDDPPRVHVSIGIPHDIGVGFQLEPAEHEA